MAVKENKEIEFTFTEFEILLLLAQNAGMVFSKEKIYNIVWKEPYFGDYNIVMSHIRNLREKIEDNPSKPIYIQTVWGVGYRFNKNLSSDTELCTSVGFHTVADGDNDVKVIVIYIIFFAICGSVGK